MNNEKNLCDQLERVARWFDGDSTECMNGAPIIRAAIEKLKTAQQQEPVLWLVNGVVQSSDIPKDYTGCLFTSPQPSKPLTDEQIMNIAPVKMTESIRALVRAVETAHGIYPF